MKIHKSWVSIIFLSLMIGLLGTCLTPSPVEAQIYKTGGGSVYQVPDNPQSWPIYRGYDGTKAGGQLRVPRSRSYGPDYRQYDPVQVGNLPYNTAPRQIPIPPLTSPQQLPIPPLTVPQHIPIPPLTTPGGPVLP